MDSSSVITGLFAISVLQIPIGIQIWISTPFVFLLSANGGATKNLHLG